jgi:hypothetical protein
MLHRVLDLFRSLGQNKVHSTLILRRFTAWRALCSILPVLAAMGSLIFHFSAGPRKANVMDKTADDWKGFRSANAEVDDELHAHQKSGDKYLEKKAFLQKAELSVYEQQRQAKIAARR